MTDSDTTYNVLFICSGNSARSQIAECLINRWGKGRFLGYSAGSHPADDIHPLTRWILQKNGYHSDNLRTKDWEEFGSESAPTMDFVITLCDKSAAESCPVWPGQPHTAHWGTIDPAAAEGPEIERKTAFQQAFRELENRISIFVNLPFHSLERHKIQEQLHVIGGGRASSQGGGKPASPKSNARALVAYSFLVVFGNDDTISDGELDMLENLALEDGVVSDDERRVLSNLFSRVDRDHLATAVWEEIQRFKSTHGIT